MAMKFKSLILNSSDLNAQKVFYTEVLESNLISESENQFTVELGWTQLTFIKSDDDRKYHYCFLVPSNMLEQASLWLTPKVSLIESEEGFIHKQGESWNADSLYFLDGNKNIAEIIVRYDLKNEEPGPFSSKNLLAVNEIGASSTDIKKLNSQLETLLGTSFLRGNFTRFGTNGDNEGLFLMVDHQIKKEWYPTNIPTYSVPFDIVVESNGTEKHLSFFEGEVTMN